MIQESPQYLGLSNLYPQPGLDDDISDIYDDTNDDIYEEY